MLYDAVRDMIYILGMRNQEHPLVQVQSGNEE
jgi:hypothetical protein